MPLVLADGNCQLAGFAVYGRVADERLQPAAAADRGDSQAVAVGNAHGDYKFPPKLDFDRIDIISQRTGIPLVLHGGSGLSDTDFETAVKLGISKINIFTDIDKAGKRGIEKGLQAGAKTMMELMPYEIEEMKAVVKEKMRLFGSIGKA